MKLKECNIQSILCIMQYTVGIWNPTIWNPETFAIGFQMVWFLDGRALAIAIATVPTIQKPDIFVQISNGFDKMATICLDLKWLGFQISDPI